LTTGAQLESLDFFRNSSVSATVIFDKIRRKNIDQPLKMSTIIMIMILSIMVNSIANAQYTELTTIGVR
jgi:hypothetical protein